MRRLLPVLLLPVLLTACSEVGSAVDTASRVQDCAALARDVAAVGLERAPSLAQAEEAARRLAERAEQADTPEVREAAGTLQQRLEELAAAARGADPAQVQRAADQVRDAAQDAAQTCGVPVDSFLGG